MFELDCKVEEADAAVVADARQPGAIGAEAHAPHLICVLAAGLQARQAGNGGQGREGQMEGRSGRGGHAVSTGQLVHQTRTAAFATAAAT